MTDATKKILHALSGNECAYPDCTEPLIAPGTEKSDVAILGHVCHIYARSDNGPRGKSDLTDEERDSYSNLILLCRNCHARIDNQHDTYPADTLKQWKREHEAKVRDRMRSVSPPLTLIDECIEAEVDRFRKSIAFKDGVKEALLLAGKLADGDYSDGTARGRMIGLAWCARALSTRDKLDDAERFLSAAEKIGSCSEIRIARAITSAHRGDTRSALRELAKIDSPESRSAGFIVVETRKGLQSALDWLGATGTSLDAMDYSGKGQLLKCQLEQGRWGEANVCLRSIDDEDFRESPVLHFLAGITHLLRAIPDELRSTVFQCLPIDTRNFPLASDENGILDRRTAHNHFRLAADAAQELGCGESAAAADEYALWLGLRGPDLEEDSRRRLMDLLHGRPGHLRFVSLAVRFGVELDFAAVERQIEQTVALGGGATYDTALARFAIMSIQRTPAMVLRYLSRYYQEMIGVISDGLMRMVEIEMLAKLGRSREALERLTRLDGVAQADRMRLEGCIAEFEGADPIDIRMQQFKETDDVRDLAQLVAGLEQDERWHDVCRYGEMLVGRTRSVAHAERLAYALHRANFDEKLSVFLESNSDLVENSEALKLFRCSSLYNDGRMTEALQGLQDLGSESALRIPVALYRELRINVRIAMGDWNEVATIVATEYHERAERNADELIQLAEIAWCLASPYAKELTLAAVEKGQREPGILLRAFHLALKYGWEDHSGVSGWLRDAKSLSGDDGPVLTMSLKDVINLRQSWDRRAAETSRLLSSSEIPMVFAGQVMHRSLGDLILGRAFSNQEERDPRRRSMIPAFSEKRQPVDDEFKEVVSVGIDGTALFTLSLLDLLDRFLNMWKMVHIPHTTFHWLLREKQLSVFYQRQILRDAQTLQQMLSRGVLETMVPSAVSSSDLGNQIGHDLAQMIAEAEDTRSGGGVQAVVVRSAPVYLMSSLMSEEADLSDHYDVLVSCRAVVTMLRAKGVITGPEERGAIEYLGIHERSWPSEPEIADNTTLYLDTLSVSYFAYLGIIDQLEASGHRIMVSQTAVSEANHLVSNQGISMKMDRAIERIRTVLYQGITGGRISIGRRIVNQGATSDVDTSHPTIAVVELAKMADAIVSDDRFVNKHDRISSSRVLSTLDIIDLLERRGTISADERSFYRTKLRRFGYGIFPLESSEVAQYLSSSSVKNGNVVEAIELRAVRENMLCLRMGRWIHGLDGYMWWMRSFAAALKCALRDLWNSDIDLSDLRARSEWILREIDIRRWIQVFEFGDGRGDVERLYAMLVAELSFAPMNTPEIKVSGYHRWLTERVLAPIKAQNPNLFMQIADLNRQMIAKIASTDPREANGSGS